MADILAPLALFLVSITSILLNLTSDERANISLLAIQYLGVFLLVRMEWSLALAAVKLVAGWIACAVLGMAILSLPEHLSNFSPRKYLRDLPEKLFQPGESRLPLGRLFNFIASLLLLLTAFSMAGKVNFLIGNLEITLLQAGFALIGLGFLKVGLNSHSFHIVVGLLTTLAGFEILYTLVDSSALVAGLLAGANLGLAFIGVYMIFAPDIEAAQ